jgi:hypothetical protein
VPGFPFQSARARPFPAIFGVVLRGKSAFKYRFSLIILNKTQAVTWLLSGNSFKSNTLAKEDFEGRRIFKRFRMRTYLLEYQNLRCAQYGNS